MLTGGGFGVRSVGETFSKEYPLENATQPEKSGGFDLFMARISR